MVLVWKLDFRCTNVANKEGLAIDHKDEEFHYEEEIVKKNLGPEYRQLIAIQAKKLKGGVKDWLHDDLTAAKRIGLRNIRLNKAIENHSTDVIRLHNTFFLDLLIWKEAVLIRCYIVV